MDILSKAFNNQTNKVDLKLSNFLKLQFSSNFILHSMLTPDKDTLFNYSILNLSTKIEQFLIFYHELFQQAPSLIYCYDSRNLSLSVQGSSEAISHTYKHMKRLLKSFSAYSFWFGFSAEKTMNYLVGVLANRPKIKYFSSQTVLQLNKKSNITISMEKDRMFMVGPAEDVQKFIQDVIVFIAKGLVMAFRYAKSTFNQRYGTKQEQDESLKELKNSLDEGNGQSGKLRAKSQIVKKNKQFSSDENENQKQKQTYISMLQKNKPQPQKINSQSSQNHLIISQQQVQFQIEKDLSLSTPACQYVIQKINTTWKLTYPNIPLVATDFRPGILSFKAKFIDDSDRKSIEQFVTREIGTFMFLFFVVDEYKKELQNLKGKNDQKVFLTDNKNKIILVARKNSDWSKIKETADIINEAMKRKSDNKSQVQNTQPINPFVTNPVIQSNSVTDQQKQAKITTSDEICIKQYQFPFLIGKEMFDFIQKFSEKNGFVISYSNNNAKKNGEKSNFIHIFQPLLQIAQGPQKQLSAFISSISQRISMNHKSKRILCQEITENTFRNLQTQKSIQKQVCQKFNAQIFIHPFLLPQFKISYSSKKGLIYGISQKECDLLIDNTNSYLLFESQSDFQGAIDKNICLKTIVQFGFYSDLAVCETEYSNFSFARAIFTFIDKLNKSNIQKVRIFIFSSKQTLLNLIWDIAEFFPQFPQTSLVFYLISTTSLDQTGTHNPVQFPNHYKRYSYTSLRNSYPQYYSELGSNLIQKTLNDKIQNLIINEQHILCRKHTHKVDMVKKQMISLQNGKEFEWKETGSYLEYQFKGQMHRVGQKAMRDIKQANLMKLDSVDIALHLIEINFQEMSQTNLFTSQKCAINSQDLSFCNLSLNIEHFPSFNSIQMITPSQSSLYKCHEQVVKKFTKFKQQSIKLSLGISQICLDKLSKLCALSSIVGAFVASSNCYVLNYEEGNCGVPAVKEYIDLINSDQFLIPYPQTWSPQADPKKNYEQHQILHSSPEFAKIQLHFPYKIEKILRLQNYNAYSRYYSENKYLQKLNKSKHVKQLQLYHGTGNINPQNIVSDSEITFNINYSSSNNYLGRATYFAANPSYSHNYRFAKNKKKGIILLCTVLVGQSQKCLKLGQNYLNTEFKTKKKDVRYESMTAYCDGSQIYAVYQNNRAYPLYLIQYDF